MKKRILCFGDSNTWGFNGIHCSRFDEHTRWTGLLQASLGDSYTVIEEGQNSRTICMDDPACGEKNGSKYILPCLESHKPLDLLIIMLGTNDMKVRFGLSAADIANEMAQFLQKVHGLIDYDPDFSHTKLLLISPIHIGDTIKSSTFCDAFDGENGIKKSRQLAEFYQAMAQKYHCHFLESSQFAKPGTADAIHLDETGHANLAAAITDYIKTHIFS